MVFNGKADETELDATKLDGSAGTSGQFLQTDGSNLSFADVSAGGKFEDALSTGQILVDDGNLYSSIQTAENNASDFMFVPAGTFSVSGGILIVDTDGLTIIGVGEDTVIDGGTDGDGIRLSGVNVTIRNLKVTSSSGDGIDDRGSDNRFINLTVDSSGGRGIRANDEGLVKGCDIVGTSSGSAGITGGNNAIILGNKIRGNVSGPGIDGGDVVASNIIDGCSGAGIVGATSIATIQGNEISDPSGDAIRIDNSVYSEISITGNVIFRGSTGIFIQGGNHVVDGNIIRDAGDIGIDVDGTDCLISNNRIFNSTNSNLDTAGATNALTDNNLTG